MDDYKYQSRKHLIYRNNCPQTEKAQTALDGVTAALGKQSTLRVIWKKGFMIGISWWLSMRWAGDGTREDDLRQWRRVGTDWNPQGSESSIFSHWMKPWVPGGLQRSCWWNETPGLRNEAGVAGACGSCRGCQLGAAPPQWWAPAGHGWALQRLCCPILTAACPATSLLLPNPVQFLPGWISLEPSGQRAQRNSFSLIQWHKTDLPAGKCALPCNLQQASPSVSCPSSLCPYRTQPFMPQVSVRTHTVPGTSIRFRG